MDKNKIIHIQLNNWTNMKEANKYLEELENGKHDNEINYTAIFYDMAIIYCITTTEEYVKKHNLTNHIIDINHTMLKSYYPEYDDKNFGCKYFEDYKNCT